MNHLTELQEIIKELHPNERAALREWLNGFEGHALIFLNPPEFALALRADRLLRRD